MTVRATKFTPEVMLSAPRRAAGIPNADASKILYTVSTYCFKEHAKKKEIRILDVKSQETTLVTDDANASDPRWLGDEVVILSTGDDGKTKVVVGPREGFGESSYVAGTIEGPVSNLKLISISPDKYGLAVSGLAKPSGTIFNPKTAPKPHSTGRLYKQLFVRHWDHYITENRNSIFVGKLVREMIDGQSMFQVRGFYNALENTGLESPVEPFGGTDHFDISVNGLACVAKIPNLNPALHTRTGLYYTAHATFWSSESRKEWAQIKMDDMAGAITGPVFSPDGKALAFLQMKTDGYESDKNQVLVVPNIENPWKIVNLLPSKDGKGKWDRSPKSIIWDPKDAAKLYLVAEDHGRGCLFTAGSFKIHDPTPMVTNPRMIVRGGNISDVVALPNGNLFISSNSLIDNSLYSLLTLDQMSTNRIYTLPDGATPADQTTAYLSSQSHCGKSFGLSRTQVKETSWPGARDGTNIHAWVIVPSDFDFKKKYPLAYLVHGGPQGAWEDGWSTRWNPAVFAEQGYVVVCPNPTGSTGYGQDFTDAIQGQWGGLPYEDLVKGFEFIEGHFGFVDVERAVALGASYGGYMMNWIQGHPLGRRFRALVTHDGVFSMTGQLSSEELYFPFHDLKGPLWSSPSTWSEWDPSRFTEHWSTPHLIIHSELDYRLTISEGLAAFNVLQARGVESQFLMFPDENHWVLKEENGLCWHRTVLDWINGHVGLPKYSEEVEEE